MVRSQVGRRTRRIAGGLLVAVAAALGCIRPMAGAEPEVATVLILLPGNDTVFLDIESGDVTSGPIEIFSDVAFTAEFFASDGTPDNRVTEARFRLDVTPANTGLVTFARDGAYSGMLQRVSAGSTQIALALVNIADMMPVFNYNIPIIVH